ncbi:MAG: hypothetical protein EOP91_04295 [Lysobacteraceae bacterium]|nr:MAG: hypothetical protein EOP91_04295 [Xanthomonadaceae bacterium]
MEIAGRSFTERASDRRADADLEAMALEIVRHVPRMIKAYPTEVEFWHWFSGEIESIRRNARTFDERERLTARLIQALMDNGIEGEMVPARSLP